MNLVLLMYLLSLRRFYTIITVLRKEWEFRAKTVHFCTKGTVTNGRGRQVAAKKANSSSEQRKHPPQALVAAALALKKSLFLQWALRPLVAATHVFALIQPPINRKP
ncbi:hypothetical protein ACOSQ2_018549 [Xanthoceras sorbifolium]